ncbi:MAG: hypothetical protein GY865_02415 [candidate division Zixibacteria bacterium]|nr:hypothetical protein [candidate division Zixibacteria bacterium]
MMILSVLLIINCSSSSTGEVENSISIGDYDPGSDEENCCGISRTNFISGIAPSGGGIYGVGLFRDDKLVQLGDTTFINEGPYQDVPLKFNVSYLDNLPPGNYFTKVFGLPPDVEMIDYEDRFISAEMGTFVAANYADSQCVNCCSHDTLRFRAYAIRDFTWTGGCKSAMADIETRYGKLCGDLDKNAMSCAWVGIQEALINSAPLVYFIQAGYMKRRDAIEGSTNTNVYLEIGPYYEDGRPIHLGFTDKPTEGSFHSYQISVNPSFGMILMRFDDEFHHQEDVSYWWTDKIMNYAVWQGEISGRETDMPGTLNDSCEFKNCRYIDSYGVYNNANFGIDVNDIIGVTTATGRQKEWGAWVDTGGTTLKIWDIFPLAE